MGRQAEQLKLASLVPIKGPDAIRDHRTRRAEHTHYIGETSPAIEGTSDANYLWRPASCSRAPPRRSDCPGEIGWGVRELSHFARKNLQSGAQIKTYQRLHCLRCQSSSSKLNSMLLVVAALPGTDGPAGLQKLDDHIKDKNDKRVQNLIIKYLIIQQAETTIRISSSKYLQAILWLRETSVLEPKGPSQAAAACREQGWLQHPRGAQGREQAHLSSPQPSPSCSVRQAGAEASFPCHLFQQRHVFLLKDKEARQLQSQLCTQVHQRKRSLGLEAQSRTTAAQRPPLGPDADTAFPSR
ncbi:putative protein C4orf45-like protein isoform X1 [Aix galericulata]|nr:putative protein C4orf45-like protein isoform X1 [Aix galericulata]